MTVSERERIAHVLRRLSMGVQPDLVGSLSSVDGAIARALDPDPGPGADPPVLSAGRPSVMPSVRNELARMGEAYSWWFGRMAASDGMLAERLVWFWTDHFAIGMQKVRSADLVWAYHATIRKYATGSFADLLTAVAKSGAMLVYLDGIRNSVQQRNENFGREVMELHTLGRDQYTQADVVAAARSFSGWVPKLPYLPQTERFAPPGTPEFASYLLGVRHDSATKTLLGKTGEFDLDGALDVILSQPAAAGFVATKLFRALVGLAPDAATVDSLAAAFRKDWSITALVHAIVETPAFRSDAAVRTLVRSPLEKLVGIMQATRTRAVAVRPALVALHTLGYLPFFAPNPAGYPAGNALLGPQQLVHAFDLATATSGVVDGSAADVLARFGVFDVTSDTRDAIDHASSAQQRTLLALGSPEFCVR